MTPQVYPSLVSPPLLLGVERVAAFVLLGGHLATFLLFSIASSGTTIVWGVLILHPLLLLPHLAIAARTKTDPYFMAAYLRSLRYATAYGARPAWDTPGASRR